MGFFVQIDALLVLDAAESRLPRFSRAEPCAAHPNIPIPLLMIAALAANGALIGKFAIPPSS
jgi:hypothetical protein